MSTDERQFEGEGWDHVAWRVERDDGPWIVKIVKDEPPDLAARSTSREAAVMRFVRAQLGPPWAAAGASAAGPELTYRRVDGVPVLELLGTAALAASDRDRLAGELGAFIAALADLDPTGAVPDLPVEDEGWASWFTDELDAQLERIAPVVSPALIATARAFVISPPPPPAAPAALGFAHNDLGGEHVLVEPGSLAIAGVIDWTDAAIADPVGDAGRLLRDLGPDAFERVLDGMAVADRAGVTARAWCFARLLAIEDLAFALDHRPRLVPFERAAFARAFEAGPGF